MRDEDDNDNDDIDDEEDNEEEVSSEAHAELNASTRPVKLVLVKVRLQLLRSCCILCLSVGLASQNCLCNNQLDDYCSAAVVSDT